MSKTKTVLTRIEKDLPLTKVYLDSFKVAMKRAQDHPDSDHIEKELYAEIRGALHALVTAGVITQSEKKVLFIYCTL